MLHHHSLTVMLALTLTCATQAAEPTPQLATTAPGPFSLLLRPNAALNETTNTVMGSVHIAIDPKQHWHHVRIPETVNILAWAVPTGLVSAAFLIADCEPFSVAVTKQKPDPAAAMPFPYQNMNAFAISADIDATLYIFGPEGQKVIDVWAGANPIVWPFDMTSKNSPYRAAATSRSTRPGHVTITPLRSNLTCIAQQAGIYLFNHHDAKGHPISPPFTRFLTAGQRDVIQADTGYVGAFHRYLEHGSTVQCMFSDHESIRLEGFHGQERQHNGPSPYKAWTAEPKSVVVVPVPEGLGVELRISILPNLNGAPVQDVTLRYGDAERVLSPAVDGAQATLTLTAEHLEGHAHARFEIYTTTWQPSVIMKSTDTRHLGVQVNDLKIRYLMP
jgi:hypothetical protein